MVVGGGGGNGKVVALATVPLRVNPVQGNRLDCQYIGDDRFRRPGGIDLAGCYVFDIIPVLFGVFHKID